MTGFKPFDPLQSPLEGTNLIEASAGTGKTYALTGLFLRLILEKDLPVSEILVVTFTEAATEALRDRIRAALREATAAFSRGKSENRFLDDLAKRHTDSVRAQEALREALRDFDQAAILTIHGFCRRMLHENAFESGSLFDTELVTYEEDIKRGIVDDFWRRHLYGATPAFVNYTMNKKFTPDDLLSLASGRAGQPYVKVTPEVDIRDTASQETAFRTCFDKLRTAWSSARAEVEDILTSDEGLKRNIYRMASIPGWIRSMDDYVASGGSNPELSESLRKFTSSALNGSVRQGFAPPGHPFFDLCDELMGKAKELEEAFDQRFLGLKAGLFRYMQEELAKRKREKNVQSFDDLLINLWRALEEPGGQELAKAIRMKFKAALIDEFQDTDPIQYAIFKRVFESENNVLFLIGDPKQAIYSFRGADIFTYMEASRDVKIRYTLGENWRSEPELIAAVNTVFVNAERPFVYDEIQFQPAKPAPRKDREILTIDGECEPPLQLLFLNASKVTDRGKVLGKTQARELIYRAVATEISLLLHLGREKRAILGERPLGERDIAVLVRKNDEACQMQKALLQLKIPNVLYSTANLFDSAEALEVERILAAMAEPKSARRLRAALATEMMGIEGEALEVRPENEPILEGWLVKFKSYHDRWNDRGFIQMFRHFMSEQGILPRLMAFSDGERRSTNVLHLVEVLQQASVERKLGMAGLLKWLSEQRDPSAPRLEEHQLRLESDDSAVKLVTIHKSKGLEYPVVFCPFSWADSKIRNSDGPFAFHDESDNMRLTLDLGSEGIEEHRVLAEKELLAENLRLFYVALTRARNRCYVVWGRFNEAETSAPAYLLHQPSSGEPEDTMNATAGRFLTLSDEDVCRELKAVRDRARGTIRLSEMDTEGGGEYSVLPADRVELTCREFSGQIDRNWHISSFSSLVSVSERPHVAELADRDAIRRVESDDQAGLGEPGVEEEPSGIFSFPRGARAGTLLHDIFEHLDFALEGTSPMEELVADRLTDHGFQLAWQETLCEMIQKVLSAPLDPDRIGLTLSRIQNKDRLNELEFYFPLKPISPNSLRGIFEECAGSDLPAELSEFDGGLRFFPVRGFMKGFMDMVFQFEERFYLVDWKSNFLGSRVEDYGQDCLARAMREELYTLQYHIYTVALNQYLSLRLPSYDYETHFGGVYYIFLRGVDPDQGPDYGIYRDRPSGELINALCESLIDRKKEHGGA